MSDFYTPDFNNLLDINRAIAPWNASLEQTNGIISQLEANRALTGVGSQEVNAQILTPDNSDNIILPDASLSQITNATITDSNISLTDSAVDVLTGQAMSEVYEDLSKFAAESDFVAKINLAFGENWDAASAKALAEGWFHRDFSDIPPVQVISSAEIGGAKGAFAAVTDTIYLSRELLAGGNLEAIADVLLEEVGHSVDSQLNFTDSPGDEGAIFAAVVQGKDLSAGELQELRGESDRGSATIGGRIIPIEMSQQWTLWYYDYRQIWNGWESSFNRSIINPVRPDGKDGIYLDWGLGAPYQDPFTGNPPTDKFAVQGRTTAQFESGKTYKFRVNTDDVVALLVVPLGGTLSDDNYLTPPQEWQNAKEPKEYIFTPQATGTYNVVFRYIDEAGNAFVDFSWEEQSLQSTLPTNPRPDFQETPSNVKVLNLRGDGNWNGENGGIEQRGTIRASSDVYNYIFTLGEPRRINIGLNELTADVDLELWWKNGNNDQLIAKSDKPNTNVESISRQLQPGTYYVKVYPYRAVPTNYNLRITELTGNIQENGLWRNYDEVDKYYKNGVNLYRFDKDGRKDDVGIDPGKNTILVVHGWTDSTETDSEGNESPIKSLGKAVAKEYPDYQVLALDWRDPARNSTSSNRKDKGRDSVFPLGASRFCKKTGSRYNKETTEGKKMSITPEEQLRLSACIQEISQ
ncbi:pre-peptidase C-terminal domain-containing protein, partial [Kamptonema sp. UHCC 0994]|uniref:pre-peptidase C-terminal domain-containing protein n=1 Tax=Kamptonema sp. UHCC 0994 TaxID=3031329 RepID=UPI0023B90602